MTAVASDLAAQHFKTRNVILFMWIRVVYLSLPLWLYVSHQPPPFPPHPSSHPFRLLLVTLGNCAIRTSARAQINFNLLIPFEKKGVQKG